MIASVAICFQLMLMLSARGCLVSAAGGHNSPNVYRWFHFKFMVTSYKKSKKGLDSSMNLTFYNSNILVCPYIIFFDLEGTTLSLSTENCDKDLAIRYYINIYNV